jgi:hypothetical protein
MNASGIDGFSMGGNTGPSLDGHRLATYAEKEGPEKQTAFMEQIFRAYFCEEKTPCDREVLLEAAKGGDGSNPKPARLVARRAREGAVSRLLLYSPWPSHPHLPCERSR